MIEYTDLLDIEYNLKLHLQKARTQFDKVYNKWGKDTVLYQIEHRHVKELEGSLTKLKKVVEVLRANKLYTHGTIQVGYYLRRWGHPYEGCSEIEVLRENTHGSLNRH